MTAAWLGKRAELAAYVEVYGNASPPVGSSSLGTWVNRMRRERKAGQLPQEAIESLDALGFVWNKHEAMWQEHVEELRAFYAEHGHFRLSKTGKLGTWVYRQVANAKKGSMAPHRKAMLHEIGFPFDDEYWEQAASQNKKKAGRKRRGAKRKPETGDRIAVALELAGVRRRSTAFDLDLVTYLAHTAAREARLDRQEGSRERGEEEDESIRSRGAEAAEVLRRSGLLLRDEEEEAIGHAKEQEDDSDDDDDEQWDDDDDDQNVELEEQLAFGIDGMFLNLSGGSGSAAVSTETSAGTAPPPAALDAPAVSAPRPLYAAAAARWGRLRATLRRLSPWTHAFFEREGRPPSYVDVLAEGGTVEAAWDTIAALLPDVREEYFKLRSSVELSDSDEENDDPDESRDGEGGGWRAPSRAAVARAERRAKKELLSEMNLHFYMITNGERWLERLDALEAHLQGGGNLDLSLKQDERDLSAWLASNRLEARRSNLAPVRHALLSPLVAAAGGGALDADPSEALFQRRLSELREWLNSAPSDGDDLLPPENERIGIWARRQRREYIAGRLPAHRSLALEALGVAWQESANVSRGGNMSFDERLIQLSAYLAGHGNQLPKVSDADARVASLARWIYAVRNKWKKGNLTDDRIEALLAAGFELEPEHSRWKERLAALRSFHAEHGHASVPMEGSLAQLHRWQRTQQNRYAAGFMPASERDMLDGLDFDWTGRVDGASA